MRSSAVSRPLRLFIGGALLATLAACGSSGDSTRQRNSALECDVKVDGTLPPGCDPSQSEKKIDCNAQWDPTTGVLTLCERFSRVDVKQKNSKGKSVKSSDNILMSDNTLTVAVEADVTKLDFKVWTLNPAGELREAGSVEFNADTTASKTFSFKPNAGTGTSTTIPEIDRQLVFGYDLHEVGQSVDIDSAGVSAFTNKSKAELKVEYRLNGVAPESNVLTATLKAYDSSGTLLSTATKSVDATKNAEEKAREWTELEITLKGDFMPNTTRIDIALTGRDGAANSGGQTGPRVTSVELKVGDKVINGNPGFDNSTAVWNVVGRSFAQCSLTQGAVPCVTDAPFETAFAAGTPEETTTTVEDTTTTVEETTTTVGEPAPEETTTTVEDTTTTVGEDNVTVQTIAPPLLVPREDCSFDWNAETRTFTACRTFRAIKVGVYGADGRYVGTASSENSDAVSLDQALATSMRFAYYSVGRDIQTEKGSLVLSRAREWLTLTDPTQDVSDVFTMDSAENPTIRGEGEPETMRIRPRRNESRAQVEWEIDGSFISASSLVLEVNGTRNVNAVTVPVDDSYSIRVYSTNEFGFLDYVAGGTAHTLDGAENQYEEDLFLQSQFVVAGGLGLVKVNTETESAGFVDPEDFVEGNIEECAGAQPILYTTPNSPSRSNRVTISLDSDCSSVNGVLAVAVVRLDLFDESGDFATSVAWWNVSSTRYSSRMTETIYLPDGNYSIFFFNPDTYFIKGIDYRVDTGGKDNACGEMALRIDTELGLAVVEGCDALAGIEAIISPLAPGATDSNDEPEQIEPEVTTIGAAIELASVPDGWWNILVTDRQQTVMGGMFAVCVRECDIQADGNSVTLDPAALASKGTVEATDAECSSMNGMAESLDDPYFYEAMVAYVQADADHAPRAAWVDGNILQDNESITGQFTARFRKPGANAIIATMCSVDGSPKSEGDPDGYFSRGLAQVDVSSAPLTVSANDHIDDAVDITGAAEVTLQQFGATLEPDEPLAGFSSLLFDRSLITTTWLKFTAPATSRVRLALPAYDTDGFDPVTTGLTVYRQNEKGQLGFVTTNMSLAQLIWIELLDEFSDVEPALSDLAAQEFNVQEGATYYVQVVGLSFLDHPKTLSVSSVDSKEWSTADIDKIFSSTTVADGESTTTTSSDGDTTTTEAPTTTESPTTTVSPTTTESPATTESPTTTTGEDPAPSTVATTEPGAITSTSVAPAASTKVAEGMMNLIENGTRNETLPVLAGSGVPTVEAREDAQTVTISMSDLVASVSKAGAEVNPQSRVVITTKNGRHIRVSQKLKSVTIPVVGYLGNQDLKISAYGTDGKELSSTITVKKSLAPLVKVKVAGNDMTGRIIALVVLLLLAILIFLFTRHARKSGAAA